ncbi:phosphotransferase [Terriglobus sp. TAA 43]|uniref:phosphotransferase n=1 Tax=Terriglobus sp. TAA 43 TaxID=278961 RepID=UPI00064671B3|nr:phosphotransferase [Terriglobus sp. TAA 43]
MLESIPQEKQPAVEKALRSAFGTAEVYFVEELTRGLSSARIFRIQSLDKDWLLRVIVRDDPMANPEFHFSCMRTAADAGLAPPILYEDIDDRILITGFITPSTFPDDMAARMADVLRTLHSLPARHRIDYMKVMDGAVQRLPKLFPSEQTDEIIRGYQRAYDCPRDERDLVACHNDLKPDNVLFDGSRIWLVDWEAAFANDRYTELAVVANFWLKDGEEQEQSFLSRYFGEEPGAVRTARFFVMRQIMSCIYGAYFLFLATQAGLNPSWQDNSETFESFHRKLVSFEVYLLDANMQMQYGLLHLKRALEQMRAPRFRAAIDLLHGES